MRKRQPSFTAALAWWLVAVVAVGVGWRGLQDGGLGGMGKLGKPLMQLARPFLETAAEVPPAEGVIPADEPTVPALVPDASRAPVSGANLLAQAVAKLGEYPALAARVRQRIELLDQSLSGAGIYQQLGRGQDQRRVRLELKLQVAGQAATLQQICDGRFLWDRRDILGSVTLSRIDLQKVRRQLAADAGPAPHAFRPWLVLGGLSQLLGGLDEHFEFSTAEPARLGKLPVWVLEGRWRAESLERWFPVPAQSPQAKRSLESRLPPYWPRQVRVVLGADENVPLFPYRVEYLVAAPGGAGQGSSPGVPLATLELFEVQLGAALDPAAFSYDPGNQEVVDRTQVFLRQLRGEGSTAGGPRPVN